MKRMLLSLIITLSLNHISFSKRAGKSIKHTISIQKIMEVNQ